MKKSFIFASLLTAILLTSCTTANGNTTTTPTTSANQNNPTTTTTNVPSTSVTVNNSTQGGSSNVLEGATYSGNYYNSINFSYEGNILKDSLRTLIKKDHVQTTYGDLRNKFVNSDKSSKSGNIITFYAHADIDGTWDSNGIYDREHVWPKANSWFNNVSNSSKGAGADMHHIRPTIKNINNTRGNLPFGDFDETKATKVQSSGYLGGYSMNGYFEPLDHSKGDVARIIFYLVTRYSEADSFSITKVAQSYDMLLQWHKLDPVDSLEINRNNYAFSVQKNRNPFIDYPGFAEAIWG